MNTDILVAVGGIGLFLLGMHILTDGLKGMAGNSLRHLITRFTKSPFSGAATGALTTAILQSSSATTVATVGFVSAGLLTFPMALGVIFGANIGTTVTGWLVAIVGFKLNLGNVLLPFLLIGTLMKMFSTNRLSHAGFALAGFSLLFVGIDAMQDGLAVFEGQITPDSFPPNTIVGRLLLVTIGIVITLVTQSSSAGLVAALIALQTGAVSFTQAAAMVIGMNIGTTFTAALAAIGGSTATRRTAFAHIIFNVITGIIAFVLLSPFAYAMQSWITGPQSNPQIALAAFHTAFNVLGVLVFIWFTDSFARLVTLLISETGPPLTAQLDNRLLKDPAAAVDATTASLRDISENLFCIMADMLEPTSHKRVNASRLKPIEEAIQTVELFTQRIRSDPKQIVTHHRHTAAIHALDHLGRLYHRCLQLNRIETLRRDPHLQKLATSLHTCLQSDFSPQDLQSAEKQFDQLRQILRLERHTYRETTIMSATRGEIEADTALDRLDSIRWLHRTTYHLWRICHHLGRAEQENPEPSEQTEAELETAIEDLNSKGK